jgi:Tfp pilus assembly protein PilO
MLLGALGLALWPLPSLASQIQKLQKDAANAQFAGKKAREASEAANKDALAQTWGPDEEIGPNIYASMDKLAAGLKVKLVGFRPQRTIDAGDVTQLPFVVNANGSYNNVVEFVRDLETPPTKVAIELLQLGSSEESSDQVVATIGVEAYVLNTSTAAPSPTAGSDKTSGKQVPTKTTAPTTTKGATPGGKAAPNMIDKQIIEKKATEVKSGN